MDIINRHDKQKYFELFNIYKTCIAHMEKRGCNAEYLKKSYLDVCPTQLDFINKYREVNRTAILIDHINQIGTIEDFSGNKTKNVKLINFLTIIDLDRSPTDTTLVNSLKLYKDVEKLSVFYVANKTTFDEKKSKKKITATMKYSDYYAKFEKNIDNWIRNAGITNVESITPFYYNDLTIDKTQHVYGCTYKKYSEQEVKELMEEKLFRKEQMWVVDKNDPLIRIYGFKVGDVIEAYTNPYMLSGSTKPFIPQIVADMGE